MYSLPDFFLDQNIKILLALNFKLNVILIFYINKLDISKKNINIRG